MSRFARQQTEDGHSKASALELFYDLVFVFSVTQVSHFLLENLGWEGFGQSLVILWAVWWSWNYTTWATNELDTGAATVRTLIFGVMLGSLLMAIAIPYAWEDRALLFAGAYVAIQLGRHAFMAFVAGERGSHERFRASRILIWFAVAGVFWIGGALAEGQTRTILWLIAVAIDFAGPYAAFWVPLIRRTTAEAWEVVSEHFTERFQLFIIIALGESIVITGATASNLETMDFTAVLALGVALFTSAALWWLYFNRAADGMHRLLENAEQRVKMARDIYTYLHVLLVLGIIVSAVGDELVIVHPTDPLSDNGLLVVAGGPVIYLLTLALIRVRASHTVGPPRFLAAAAIAALGLLAHATEMTGLTLASLILAVLAALIMYEERRYRRTNAAEAATA